MSGEEAESSEGDQRHEHYHCHWEIVDQCCLLQGNGEENFVTSIATITDGLNNYVPPQFYENLPRVVLDHIKFTDFQQEATLGCNSRENLQVTN